jgi:curved DNA-binding protein CbpA
VTFDPYQVLGVDRAVDALAIRRAYRSRAKKLHPDAGGSAEAFSRLSRAHLVLADPARRARFDRDGTIDESAADNSFSKAVSVCVGFFAAAVEHHVRSGAPDPTTVDLVSLAREAFRKEITKYEEQKRPIERARKKLEQVEARLRAKKTANPLLRRALKQQAASTAGPLAQIDAQITAYRDAIALLDGYEYAPDIDPDMARMAAIFEGINSAQARFYRKAP